MKSKEQYEARARVAKALAHPSRLLLLDLLQQQEMCVADLTEAVGADQSTVSKHLALLQSAGLIGHRKAGTANYYRVTCGCLEGFFNCMEAVVRLDVEKRKSTLA